MRKKSSSKSGFVTPRNLITALLCAASVSLTALSFAATPALRKISPNKKTAVSAKPVHPIASPVTLAAGPAPTAGALSTSNRTLTYTDAVGPVPNATGEGVTGAPVQPAWRMRGQQRDGDRSSRGSGHPAEPSGAATSRACSGPDPRNPSGPAVKPTALKGRTYDRNRPEPTHRRHLADRGPSTYGFRVHRCAMPRNDISFSFR